MLSVREISITYGENPVPAVADFSLEMKRGEIVSIVGRAAAERLPWSVPSWAVCRAAAM